jgi:hypothetical protein
MRSDSHQPHQPRCERLLRGHPLGIHSTASPFVRAKRQCRLPHTLPALGRFRTSWPFRRTTLPTHQPAGGTNNSCLRDVVAMKWLPDSACAAHRAAVARQSLGAYLALDVGARPTARARRSNDPATQRRARSPCCSARPLHRPMAATVLVGHTTPISFCRLHAPLQSCQPHQGAVRRWRPLPAATGVSGRCRVCKGIGRSVACTPALALKRARHARGAGCA